MASVESRAGSWRVVWRQDGAKQYEPFGTESEAESFRQLVEGSRNRWPHGWVPHVGFGTASTAPKFRDWAERAIEQRPKASDRTKADYRRDLANHVYPQFGRMRVDEITTEHVSAWIKTMVAGGLSAKTITNLHGLASSVMKDALTHRPPLTDHNPFAGRLRNLPDVRTEDMTFLTPSEFDLVLSRLLDWYRPLAVLLYATGLRFGEATALRVRDLNLLGSRATLTVVRAWKRQPDMTYSIGEPKTRRSRRTIALSQETVDALLPVVAGKRGEELVITSKMGYPLLNSTFHDAGWAPAVARAMVCDYHYDEQRLPGRKPPAMPKPCDCPGVLDKRPRIHDCRHSHAAWLISEGLPLAAIARRLGHASIQTTVDRYGHLMPDLDDDINAAVDRSLGAQRVVDHADDRGSDLRV